MKVTWTETARINRGKNTIINYDIENLNQYGNVLVARTDKGICFLGLPNGNCFDHAIHIMRSYFPSAQFVNTQANAKNFTLDIIGTKFQIAVWKEILKVTEGQTATYKHLCDKVGKPKAWRAVGSAVGANPVSIYIPCHRILGTNGNNNGYAWGEDWKNRLLQKEKLFANYGKS